MRDGMVTYFQERDIYIYNGLWKFQTKEKIKYMIISKWKQFFLTRIKINKKAYIKEKKEVKRKYMITIV